MKMKVGLLSNEIPPIVYGGVATWIMNFLDMFAEDDELLILRILRSHRFHTRSHIAKDIITHWNKEKIHFSKIVPKAMENINLDKIYNQQASYRMGVLLNE